MKIYISKSAIAMICFFMWYSNPQDTNAQIPAYEAESWVRLGGPVGGLGYDIRYNFNDHNIWYVTDAWSGFHISTDRGLTWFVSNKGITSIKGRDAIPVFCATVDPHEPSTIWIGTEGTGDIFKSIDGGYTWTLKRNGVSLEQQALTFRGFTVDPRTSDIVYAMAEIGSSGWTQDGQPVQGIEMDLSMGIVFKTTNGGENWTEIWRGNNLARYCWINPHEPEMIYVSTGIFDRESANTDTAAGIAGGVGILKSTNGGTSWQVLNEANGLLDLYIGSLFMHPENPDTLLAAAGQNNWSGYNETHTGGVYITTNGGEKWDRVIGNKEIFTVVEYSTTDSDIAYALSPDAVYRSHDAGFTWQRFTKIGNMWGPPGFVAGFPIDMQCDPEDPMRIIVNNYLGGNLLSADGGEAWTLASKGYTGALMHHIYVVPDTPQKVYAGSRSGVYKSENGGEDWIGLVNPPKDMWAKFNEIRALSVNPKNSDHVLTMPNDLMRTLYSYNGGASWEIGAETGGINSMLFAPSDSSIVYAAADKGLFISYNGGKNFNLVRNDNTSKNISTMAIHPANSQILYVSTSTDGLLKSTDGGQTWDVIGTGLPSLPSNTLAIHPVNPDLMFAGVSAESPLGGQGVYRSVDGGNIWTQQGAGMEPNSHVTSIVVDPSNVNVVYACDHMSGVYVSTDRGDTWKGINEKLDHRTVNVLSLSGDGTVLYAGTMGAGVYRLGDIDETSVEASKKGLPRTCYLSPNYPNPFNSATTFEYDISEHAHVQIQIMNIQGQSIRSLVNKKMSVGSYTVRWDGTNESGDPVSSSVYFCRMKILNQIKVQKIVLLR